MSTAEDLRQQGNICFAAKRYDEALALYKQAIELSPREISLHNNAAAAHHALQQYSEAIECARRSLAIENNYKAHSRIGASLWAMGRLQEALSEYDAAAAMSSGNNGIMEAQRSLRQLLSSPQLEVPERPVGITGAALDALVAVLSLLTVLAVFLSPARCPTLWTLTMAASVARELFIAKGRGLLRADRAVLMSWADHRCTLLALLSFLALLSGVAAQPLLLCAVGMYALSSFAANRQLPPALTQPLAPLLHYVSVREKAIIMYAATIEAVMLFTIMLTGGAIFTLVYIQYVKNIYRIDRNVRFAFTGLRTNVGQVLRHPYVPPAINTYTQKGFDLLYTMSQNSF